MIDGPKIRAQSQIRLAVNRYFSNDKNNAVVKVASKEQKQTTFQKLLQEIEIYLSANQKRHPDIKVTDIKYDSITRNDRNIPDRLVPLLYHFFYNSTPDNYKIISRSHNEITRHPYSDDEMKGLEEGVFKVMRYSTTKKCRDKEILGVVSISWLEIRKEAIQGTDCSFWYYEQIKVIKKKDEAYADAMTTLHTEGIIKKNYGQYLFIGAEQYSCENKEETGTQIMFINHDNDSENLRGILLTTINYGYSPVATRIFLKKAPKMKFTDTYVDNNSEDIADFIENNIDDTWHMLLPPTTL